MNYQHNNQNHTAEVLHYERVYTNNLTQLTKGECRVCAAYRITGTVNEAALNVKYITRNRKNSL